MYALWPAEAVELSGEISSYDGRGFCPRCGSRLLDTADPDRTLVEIRIGSLDDAPFELKPDDEIWVKRRESWIPPVDGAAQHDESRKPVGRRPLARSFGAVAATYDRVRPPYFQPPLDRAQQALDLAPEATVLDLGAGTGRLTRELVRRFGRVFAVEPDDEMRALIGAGEILPGTAEQIPLADDAVDAVFVSEAFHWFDPAATVAELARVLRPRGGLAIISTHWWETEPPLPDAVQALFREPFDRSLGERLPPWDNAFLGSPFEPLARERYEEAMTVDADVLLAMYSTTSALAALPDEEREALFAAVRPRLAGPYRLPIEHTLAWTRLRAEPRSRTRGSAAPLPD